MGFKYFKAAEPAQGDYLTTKSERVSDTHLINFGRMKGSVDLDTTEYFRTRKPWNRNLRLKGYKKLHL